MERMSTNASRPIQVEKNTRMTMKQYTNESQTAKLIELGFEKPKMAAPALKWVDGEPTFEPQYTIGELIEMLPKTYDSEELSIGWHYMADVWIVRYPMTILIHKEELVDALYDMVVKLKEEEVI